MTNETLPKKTRRRPVNKTFTGCQQCRQRKIKCDEARPSCRRCQAKGLDCPGYDTIPWRLTTTHRPASERKKEPQLPEQSASDRRPSQTSVTTRVSADTRFRGNSVDSSFQVFESHPTPRSNTTTVFDAAIDFSTPATAWSASSDTQTHALSSSRSQSEWSDNNGVFSNVVWADEQSDGASEQALVRTRQKSISDSWNQLRPSPLDPGTDLVSKYFRFVAPTVSVFDSDLNPFRSAVVQSWQTSLAVKYAIQSMAGAQLVSQSKGMAVAGLQTQRLAIRQISIEVSKSSRKWSAELLFAILLLGISTIWHDPKDYGVVHLRALRQALLRGGLANTSGLLTREFFKNALIYWEMVACLVDDDLAVDENGIPVVEQYEAWLEFDSSPRSASESPRIVPHPWTGVAAELQLLFTRTTKLIRHLRATQKRPVVSNTSIVSFAHILAAAERLEARTWNATLPDVSQIDDAGDSQTLASHHLSIAEAYQFATLYMLYFVFPDTLTRRRKILEDSEATTSTCASFGLFLLRNEANYENCLRFLSKSIIACLEQIPIDSRTTCISILPMIVATGSLSVRKGDPESETQRVLAARQLLRTRLDYFRYIFPVRHVDMLNAVISAMLERLDRGLTVFWVDVMTELKLETVLG